MKEGVFLCRNSEELAREGADRFARLAAQASKMRGCFRMALAGGRTPREMYRILSTEPFAGKVSWKQVEVFWGDERWVPKDHPDSNYRMAYEALLSRVTIPPGNVHPMPTTGDPENAALAYEREIRRSFDNPDLSGEPRFDLILLGLGEDGHTASIFPNSPALHEKQRLVAAPYVTHLGSYRITLTLPVLCAAEYVMFLVSGKGKGKALAATLNRKCNEAQTFEQTPAQLVQPVHGTLTWLVDREAWAAAR